MTSSSAMELFRVVAAGLGAGVVAILVTVAIERWGGRVGGLLGTLPSTIVPAAWGIHASSSGDDAFRSAMFGVPPGMFLNAVFLWMWGVLPGRLPPGSLGRRLAMMTLLSLGVWLGLAVALVLGLDALGPSLPTRAGVGLGAFLALVGVGAAASRRRRAAPRGTRRVPLAVLLSRGVVAGLAITGAVLLAEWGGALAAGVASVFPAIFLTTMVSLWLSQGEAVPAGAVGPMMLGSSSVAAFALVAAWGHPVLGPGLGSLLAWGLAALLVTGPAVLWLQTRREPA